MPEFEEPVRLQAFEYRRRLDGGLTRPVLAGAYDQDGAAYEVVLKVRDPDVDRGHFGPTSLACELICSVLARATGVSVPDYFVVDVADEFVAAVPERSARALLACNVGSNFATAYLAGFARYEPSVGRTSAELLDALEGVLSFDATVINGDRKASKSNLLRRGDNLYAIDHSIALPVNLWPAGHDDAAELFPDDQIVEHCAFDALRRRGRDYESQVSAWLANVTQIELSRLRSWIPTTWEKHPGELDRIFRFLHDRSRSLSLLKEGLRRVVG